MESSQMLAAAETYAHNFTPNALTAEPVRKVAVLTCMDARLDLFRLLGLQVGDSHLLRNAGGRASDDALRSLVLSANALGTREFVVIHHTGCGLHRVSNRDLSDRVEAQTGNRPEIDFLPFDDEVVSVTVDVDRIAKCRYLPRDAKVWGAVFHVHTGTLVPVCEPVNCRQAG